MIRLVLLIQWLICYSLILQINSKQRQHGPGWSENDTTTCDQFSEYARFNPYSVLDVEWMVFYYWGPVQSASFYRFYILTENYVELFKEILDDHVKEAINWNAKLVLMKERNNAISLLVERSYRGEYNLYKLFRSFKKGEIVEPLDVRLKQTGDNRFLGFMICETRVVYIMARLKDVPPKSKIQDTVGRLGYRDRGGRSYLYQGHQWMPIPEAEESTYWHPNGRRRWYLYE